MGKCRITPLCFVCFKPASAKDGNHEGNYSLEFLQFFTRFLEIPLKTPVQNQDFVCCDDCFEIRESFRDEYFEWEKLRLQLELRVRELFEIIRAAGKVPSRVREFKNQYEINEEDVDGDNLNKVYYDIQKLRKEILRGCKKKLNSSFPRVVLERIPNEDEISLDQPVDSVENFKLLHRMMTYIAVFQLSLPQPVTNLCQDNDRVPPTTSTFPSVETNSNSNPLHVIESPEVINAEVYDCAGEFIETRDEIEVPNTCHEAQTGSHVQQHDDLVGQVYEELQNKEHPKFHLEAAQDHHSSEIPGTSATLNAGPPEAIGKVFNNTQKPCKLQDIREVRKKWLRAAKRASSRFRLTRRLRCRKSFYKHTSLHQKTHSDKRPFKCTTCESCFCRKDALSIHMREKHGVDNPHSSETVNNTSLSGELTPPKATRISDRKRKLEEKQQLHSKASSSLPVPGKRSSSPQISNPLSFRCVTCQKSLPTRYQLTRHSATHSGKCPFKCTCGSCFRSKDGFSKHIKEVYKQDQTHHQLVRQLTTKKGGRSFNCTTCGASLNANSSLTRHITIVHGVDNLHSSKTVKNPSLGGESTPPTAIEISNSEQKPEGKYQPDLQLPHSKSSSSLPIPEKPSSTPKISASRRFRCGTCQKSFSTRYDFTRHSATHSRKCPFKCTCGSSFRSKGGFSIHIKETYQLDKSNHQLIQQLTTKKGEATFQCTTCGASFNANYGLTRHITTVHGVDNLHSSETVKNASLSDDLTPTPAIKRRNSEQKLEGKHHPDLQQPHTKSLSSLPIPEKRSSTTCNSRRFRCGTCQKSFSTRYDLKRHSATHSGKRPFKCTCGSGFITKTSFSKHIKEAYQHGKSNHKLDRKLLTQTGELAFICTTCGAAFNRSFSLTRHLAIVHNVEKKVEIQEGMVNLALGGSTQGNAGSAPKEKKVTVSKLERKLELNGVKSYYYTCHECPYQGKDSHRFQSHRQLHEDGSDVVVCSVCGWHLRPTSLPLHQKLHHPSELSAKTEDKL